MTSGLLKIGSNYLKIGGLYLRIGPAPSATGWSDITATGDPSVDDINDLAVGTQVLLVFAGKNGGAPSAPTGTNVSVTEVGHQSIASWPAHPGTGTTTRHLYVWRVQRTAPAASISYDGTADLLTSYTLTSNEVITSIGNTFAFDSETQAAPFNGDVVDLVADASISARVDTKDASVGFDDEDENSPRASITNYTANWMGASFGGAGFHFLIGSGSGEHVADAEFTGSGGSSSGRVGVFALTVSLRVNP